MSSAPISFGSYAGRDLVLPQVVFQHVLSFLESFDLKGLMRICKKWKGLAQTSFKASVVNTLRLNQSCGLLAVHNSIRRLFTSKHKLDFYIESINAKKESLCVRDCYEESKILSNGITAAADLYKLGFLSKEKLKEYANVSGLGHIIAPTIAARAFIEKKELAYAKEVLLQANPMINIGDLVLKIITLECQNYQFEEAKMTFLLFEKRLNKSEIEIASKLIQR